MLHLMHAVSQSYTGPYFRTVDSDIVVLAIAFFDQLRLSKLWVGVGTGKHCRDIPVHDIKSALGPTRLLALPLLHALSGCDTTSQLLGIGKKTAWFTWQSMSELRLYWIWLTTHTHSVWLERFTEPMYSRSCSATSEDEARLQPFTHGSCTLKALPPTKAALYQHVKRAILLACFFWKQSVSSQQVIPDFAEWGWKTRRESEAVGAILDKSAWRQLCMFFPSTLWLPKSRQGSCKCARAGLRRTSLCKCDDGCINTDNE